MNKTIVSFTAVVFLVTSIVACKGKRKEGESTTTTTEQTAADTKPAEEKSSTANSAKTYKVSFAPDSVILGKEKEAFVKLLSGEAIELQDADGKSTGMNVKFVLRATNRSTLDNKKFFNVSDGDARLELDNGTNITIKHGASLNPDPEASLEGTWEFEIPAGTKPAKLNLFYDGTRVGVALGLK